MQSGASGSKTGSLKASLASIIPSKNVLLRNLKLPGLIILVVVILTMGSAIPWKFTYLEIGRLIPHVSFFDRFVLFLIAILIVLISTLTSMRLKKNNTIWLFGIGLIMSFLVIFSCTLIFMPRLAKTGQKIDAFVVENGNKSLHVYVQNISTFLIDKLRNSYNRPEASLEIDNWIFITLLDPYIMEIWAVTRADVILHQGWGACGQAAILIEELLYDAGYETRRAYFKNIDHIWAEVKENGDWLVVDPWYIGNLVEIQNLKSVKPEFQEATGVEAKYRNGTVVDASLEHGY